MMLDPGRQAKMRTDKLAQSIKVALKQADRNLKILSDAGVPIAMGSDTGSFNNPGRWQGYFEHTEMEMMAKAGMTPMQVLVVGDRRRRARHEARWAARHDSTGEVGRPGRVDRQPADRHSQHAEDRLGLDRRPAAQSGDVKRF